MTWCRCGGTVLLGAGEGNGNKETLEVRPEETHQRCGTVEVTRFGKLFRRPIGAAGSSGSTEKARLLTVDSRMRPTISVQGVFYTHRGVNTPYFGQHSRLPLLIALR